MDKSFDVPESLAQKGVTRRDFMKFCGFMATVPGSADDLCPQDRRSPREEATYRGLVAVG